MHLLHDEKNVRVHASSVGVKEKAKEVVMNFNLIRREPTYPLFRPFGEPFFREMEEMSDRLNRYLTTPLFRPYEKEALKLAEWAPVVDIEETETEYLVKAELPEIQKQDVKVTVENGVLTIQGERKLEKEEKGKKFHRVERSYGTFLRTFTVPEEVEASKVTAEFKDGILRIRLPKTEKVRPKAIEVKLAP
jgi:HSP20 family protein